jgi:glycosyltransferase involved in cell wall biosynthesis
VLDHETGFVVSRPRDPAAIVAALRPLLDDRFVRRRMGAAARDRAQACFDYEILVPRLAEALAKVGG